MSYDLDCVHEHRLVVWTNVGSNGDALSSRQLREQCVDCGRLMALALPHRNATAQTPNVDLPKLAAWLGGRETHWDQNAIARREEQERRDAEWRAGYDAYINSDAWRHLWAKILRRDGYICQGCLTAPASQVHHHTYSHMGLELAWQLVAVCEECHDRFHAKGDAA